MLDEKNKGKDPLTLFTDSLYIYPTTLVGNQCLPNLAAIIDASGKNDSVSKTT